MTIRALRFLHIEQGSSKKPPELRLGEVRAEPGGDHEALHSQLKRLFNAKPGKRYGCFSGDIGENPLSGWLKDYLSQRQGFDSLTQRLGEHLRDLIAQTDLAHEGPLLLVHEALAEGEVIYLFALETDSSLCLTRQLELDAVDSLSQSRLSLALRVEIDDWLGETPGQTYLTLLRARGTGDWGEVFEKLTGFENQVDVEQETRTFMDAVEAFARHGDEAQAQAIRSRAYEFCRDQQSLGEPVRVDALSSHLDERQPERFSQFAAQEQSLPPETILHPDQRRVRKLVRLSGQGHGMSLSFSSDLVNQAVYYERENDRLIITRLPRALKEQLQRYLEED